MAIFGGGWRGWGGLTCMENKKLSMSLYNYKRLNNTSNNLKKKQKKRRNNVSKCHKSAIQEIANNSVVQKQQSMLLYTITTD